MAAWSASVLQAFVFNMNGHPLLEVPNKSFRLVIVVIICPEQMVIIGFLDFAQKVSHIFTHPVRVRVDNIW